MRHIAFMPISAGRLQFYVENYVMEPDFQPRDGIGGILIHGNNQKLIVTCFDEALVVYIYYPTGGDEH